MFFLTYALWFNFLLIYADMYLSASRGSVIWYSGVQVFVSCYKNWPLVVASSSSRNSLVLCTGMTTLNKERYFDMICRFRDAVRRKSSEMWRTNSLFPLHDNAPAHRSVLFKDFLAKNNVTTLEPPPPPHTPDLAPAGFYLFFRLQSSLNGGCFCDATDIINNATVELKRLSQNGSQKCFQHLYIHWHKNLVAQGDYLKET